MGCLQLNKEQNVEMLEVSLSSCPVISCTMKDLTLIFWVGYSLLFTGFQSISINSDPFDPRLASDHVTHQIIWVPSPNSSNFSLVISKKCRITVDCSGLKSIISNGSPLLNLTLLPKNSILSIRESRAASA